MKTCLMISASLLILGGHPVIGLTMLAGWLVWNLAGWFKSLPPYKTPYEK